MSSWVRRGWAATVIVALSSAVLAFGVGPREASAAAPKRPAPTQDLALLLSVHTARAAPATNAAFVQRIAARRPLTGERTALPVLRRATRHGATWLLVLLPGRPNGRKGWIMARSTTRAFTRWHLVVDTSTRRLTAYRLGRAMRTFSAVVGKPSTPTPQGVFFVEEAIELSAGDVGAPFALALSARSNVLQEFDGGPGQIGVHGLMNVGGVPGTATSHGCVRLENAAMRWLVARIGPGVPVTISG